MKSQGGKAAFAFMMPALLIMGLILFFPIGYSFFLSVIDSNSFEFFTGQTKVVGGDNYVELAKDASFWNSLLLHAVFIVATTVVEVGLALVVAIYLDRVFPISKAIQTFLILPMFMIPVVSGLSFRFIFNPESGVWGQIFYFFGKEAPDLLGDPFLAMGVVILQDIWRMWPFLFLIIYAGLQAIPKELYEAMTMDGAKLKQLIKYLIVPSILPTLYIATILKVIESLKAFTEIYVMTGGGPGESTSILSMYIVKQVTEFSKFGTGSAASLVLFFLAFGVTLVFSQLTKAKMRAPTVHSTVT